jgi:hypothetical protein
MMKKLIKIITFVTMTALPFACSNNNNINKVVQEQVKGTEDWQKGDAIPSLLISNKYKDIYFADLYEYGGLVDAAVINQITNKNLLLNIISSCDARLDRKPSLHILKDINFGENRLFDFYYNYSTRQIATLRYRVLYGSKNLADQITHLNPNCKNLNSDTALMMNGIKYSGNDKGTIGFIIELKRLKMNKDIIVDQKAVEKIASHILEKSRYKPTFKELDKAAADIIKSTTSLNPGETFQINYEGPYLTYKQEKEGLNISHKSNEVFFSLQMGRLY